MTNLKTLICIGLLPLAMQGCATTHSEQSVLEEVAPPPQVKSAEAVYTVQSGDNLSAIAKKLTGDAANWRAIAELNNLSEPWTLTPGEILRIPQELLVDIFEIDDDTELLAKEDDTQLLAKDDTKALETERTASVNAASTSSKSVSSSAAIGNTMAVQRVVERAETPFGPVTTHAVSINRTFDLVPHDEPETTANNRKHVAGTNAPSIKVLGTYFPKGVYEGPANYTKLLMRVPPGTVFELHSEINDWYKVITEEGIGYLRAADAELIADVTY